MGRGPRAPKVPGWGLGALTLIRAFYEWRVIRAEPSARVQEFALIGPIYQCGPEWKGFGEKPKTSQSFQTYTRRARRLETVGAARQAGIPLRSGLRIQRPTRRTKSQTSPVFGLT